MQTLHDRCVGRRPVLEGLVVEFRPSRVAKVTPALKELGYSFGHIADWEQLTDNLQVLSAEIAILANLASSGNPHDAQLDFECARYIRERNPDCSILFVINNVINLDACARAIDLGVCGFVNIDEPDFYELLGEQIEQIRDRIAKEKSQVDLVGSPVILDQAGIATQSVAMYKLLAQARQAAKVCDAPIIIEGESGTGKQLLAEAIHKMDDRRSSRPFLSVNCAAITGTLAESALFGHKKGAFTGATEDRLGYFRSANGGTLMLDEISELEPALQPKLLRVLQEDRVLPVGDDREHPVDVRIIVASNKQLAQEVTAGRFRLDLYQRLNVIKLRLPPLRERLEDIPLLVQYFLKKYHHYYSQPIRSVDTAVYAVLRRAVGQGNIRELENIIRQSLVFKTSGSIFTVADLPEHIRTLSKSPDTGSSIPTELTQHISQQLARGHFDFDLLMEQMEHEVLSTAINKLGLKGNQLAERLGLNRRTLYHKLHRHNLI